MISPPSARWRGRGRARASRAAVLAVGLASGLLTCAALRSAAEAQVISSQDDRYRSPQRFALELRFGPYKPDIDSEFNNPERHPYRDFFGPNRRLMSQFELDYQVIRHVGTLGVGVGAGYFKETGHNLLADGSGVVSADTSTLRLLPLSLSAVYRFDLMWERLRIPLVPYAKVGLDYIFWTINDGNGDIPENETGGRGQGGTWGWHAALGVSFVLNFLDPVSATQFDAESGVNRTHLFFEWTRADVSGLGASGKLHVGDSTWVAGMLFEF